MPKPWQILRSALLSWQWPPATLNPLQSCRQYGHYLQPCGALLPWAATYSEMLMLLMKVHPYGRNNKNVPSGAHLGRWPSLLCGDVSRHLDLMLSPWADRISLTMQRSLNVTVKCWIRLFVLSNTSISNCLMYPLLCFSRACSWLIMEVFISLRNNKQCRLIAEAQATEQKQSLQKYAANDWVSPSLFVSVCMCLCIYARL